MIVVTKISKDPGKEEHNFLWEEEGGKKLLFCSTKAPSASNYQAQYVSDSLLWHEKKSFNSIWYLIISNFWHKKMELARNEAGYCHLC